MTFAFVINVHSQTYIYDFTNGYEGWTGDFADYPVTDSVFYKLEFLRTTLPPPLDTSKYALKITGNNHSDDLFMFIKREITGLLPNTNYQLLFNVEFASKAPPNAIGVGGPPGEGVTMKAGATLVEPVKMNTNGFYLMNIDKANQKQPGIDMDTIGHVGVTDTTTEFTLISRNNATHLLPIRTDANGKVWICIGTDSGFEATTTLYYTQITVTFANTTGISELPGTKDDVEIYPIPTSDIITVKVSPTLLYQNVKMIDQIGKVVYHGILNSEISNIAVDNLPMGIYLLQIGENFKQIYKMIKE